LSLLADDLTLPGVGRVPMGERLEASGQKLSKNFPKKNFLLLYSNTNNTGYIRFFFTGRIVTGVTPSEKKFAEKKLFFEPALSFFFIVLSARLQRLARSVQPA